MESKLLGIPLFRHLILRLSGEMERFENRGLRRGGKRELS